MGDVGKIPANRLRKLGYERYGLQGSDNNAFGDVAERAPSRVGRGFGQGVSHSSLATTCHGHLRSWTVEEPVEPPVGYCWGVVIGIYTAHICAASSDNRHLGL